MIARIIKLQSATWWLGFCLLLFSFLLHLLLSANNSSTKPDDYFILNFCITGVYALTLFFCRKSIPITAKQAHRILLYGLMLVSAWALNNTMPVFEFSVLWMSIIQVLVVTALVLLCFFRYLPAVANHISVAIIGVGALLFFYLSIYLFPIYVFGIILSPALGISLHCFAPVLIFSAIIVLLIKMCSYNRTYLYSFFLGLLAAIIVTVVFCVQWTAEVKAMNKAYRFSMINDKPDVPAWLQLSQQLPKTSMTEKILKLNLVYTLPSSSWDVWGFSMPSRNFSEAKKHDPLIAFASMLAKPSIGEEERIRILESTYNNRYATEERLWSGNNLVTENVLTTIEVWPQWQMAYTEKTIAVRNNASNEFRGQEEGIYLFTLPEGSVVSSLSLWINGIEEKGILTTKEKATTAYKTIVGVESRDPSVVHWQEGNQVSVRVFPIMPANNRIFKIGITSPLRKYGNEITYENIFFQGPPSNNASETISFKISGKSEVLDKPTFLKSENENVYQFDGKYKPNWTVDFKVGELSNNSFVYKGKGYSVSRYEKRLLPHTIEQVYLDINSEWNKQEVDDILLAFKNKNIIVYKNGWKNITNENADILFEELKKQSFSLFPIYDIINADKSLLITKGNAASPNLKDLKETPFEAKTKKYLKSGVQLQVLDLGKEISPYLKTLVEYRAINYEKCDMPFVQKIASANELSVNQETDDMVVLKDAELVIKRLDSVELSNAPDHLYRLFAYNNIMRQMGKHRDDTLHNSKPIISEAEHAYIVTPVSSLIVLESQADYERFNIKDSKDNLQNASHNKSGAVPEPHEWALIIVGLISLWHLHKMNKEKTKYSYARSKNV